MWTWKRLAAIALGGGMIVAGSLIPGIGAALQVPGAMLLGHAINGQEGGKGYGKKGASDEHAQGPR